MSSFNHLPSTVNVVSNRQTATTVHRWISVKSKSKHQLLLDNHQVDSDEKHFLPFIKRNSQNNDDHQVSSIIGTRRKSSNRRRNKSSRLLKKQHEKKKIKKLLHRQSRISS